MKYPCSAPALWRLKMGMSASRTTNGCARSDDAEAWWWFVVEEERGGEARETWRSKSWYSGVWKRQCAMSWPSQLRGCAQSSSRRGRNALVAAGAATTSGGAKKCRKTRDGGK